MSKQWRPTWDFIQRGDIWTMLIKEWVGGDRMCMAIGKTKQECDNRATYIVNCINRFEGHGLIKPEGVERAS